MYTKIDTFANSVDPDETVHNEPSYLVLHRLPFSSRFTSVTLLATMGVFS